MQRGRMSDDDHCKKKNTPRGGGRGGGGGGRGGFIVGWIGRKIEETYDDVMCVCVCDFFCEGGLLGLI